MSQIEPTDLLCRSRREELSADEQRRLKESLAHSFEVRLMSDVLSALDTESSVRPGDELLLARISAQALGVPGRGPVRRRPLTMLLVAAAVLLVAGLAGAWIGGVRVPKISDRAPKAIVAPPAKAVEVRRPRAIARPVPSETAEIAPAAEEPAEVAPALPSRVPAPPSGGFGLRHAEQAPKAVDASAASELFARANLRRRQGRGVEAAALYQLLLDLYPSAREVGPTRLALAKYFQATQPERALAQYRAVARAGGSLRAEALWGISETASHLAQRPLAEQALTDLLREFPDSPYAEVARTRTAHGLP